MGLFNPHIMDAMAYQRQYEIWRETASKLTPTPYLKNLRTVDVVNTLNVATTDTGTGKSKAFFGNQVAALAGDPSFYSPPQDFPIDGKVPSGSFYGLYAMGILISVQYGTVTQLNTLMVGFGAGRFNALIGNDPIASGWALSSMMSSFDGGYLLSNDNTTLVARSGFAQMQPRVLPWAKNLNPAAAFAASVTYTMATIAVAFNVALHLSCFAGDAGTG